jgi:hypothetical protein
VDVENAGLLSGRPKKLSALYVLSHVLNPDPRTTIIKIRLTLFSLQHASAFLSPCFARDALRYSGFCILLFDARLYDL